MRAATARTPLSLCTGLAPPPAAADPAPRCARSSRRHGSSECRARSAEEEAMGARRGRAGREGARERIKESARDGAMDQGRGRGRA
eukprot:3645944-Rhodomonas_salina.1